MLYKNYEDLINKIVWVIPFRNKRNSVRDILNDILNTASKIEYIADSLNVINDNKNDFVIIWIGGGFADQIKKYLLGKYIEKNYGKNVKYDIEWYNGNRMDNDGKEKRTFELLNCFPELDFVIASKDEIRNYKRLFYVNGNGSNVDDIVKNKRNIYLDRYPYYSLDIANRDNVTLDFDKYLLPRLNGPNLECYKELREHPASVSVHIRRGDFRVMESFNTIFKCSEEKYIKYFFDAINLMTEKLYPVKPKFFFFSNDIDWVKDKILNFLPKDCDFVCSEGDNSDKVYIDMYLISSAKHTIVSLGGFADTAFIFNKNKNAIMISPLDIVK